MPRNRGTSRKGKPKKAERAAGMGRALQKAHQGSGRGGGGGSNIKKSTGGMAATTTVSLGFDGEHDTAPKSVLELDHLEDFLTQANLAGREFASEKERFVVMDATGTEYKTPLQIQQEQEANPRVQWADQQSPSAAGDSKFEFQELSVPRRPEWSSDMTTEQLEHSENQAFLEWRRGIANREEELFAQQEEHGVNMNRTVTPFEKNLDVWRQLWRVLERCSCIVQLVDARNPLFYLSEDLRRYATEELGKPMVVIVNKSDYLTPKQRKIWSHYLLHERGWDHVFFSAHIEQKKLDDLAQKQRQEQEERLLHLDQLDKLNQPSSEEQQEQERSGEQNPDHHQQQQQQQNSTNSSNNGVNVPLTRKQLIQWLYNYAIRHNCERDARYDDRIQFGMVGFPNVGKSSVINVLVGSSKHTHNLVRVGVASQPGKTKHFQTLYLPDRDDIMLCDCPGLVFPSFVSSTADLIAAGVYPIAQMRDYWPVTDLICQRIPRRILCAQYGITIDSNNIDSKYYKNTNGEEDLPPPTAEEFLSAYCYARSILAASSGAPDYPRAARVIITDYVSGKLLYCHAPPILVIDNDVDDNDGDDELTNISVFEHETIITAMQNNARKLKNIVEQSKEVATEEENIASFAALTLEEEKGTGDDDTSEYVEAEGEEQEVENQNDWDDNDMLLDILGDSGNGGGGGRVPKRQHASENKKASKKDYKLKKWGKKNRKQRNKDPYGCHSTPDELMLHNSRVGESGGVMVNAGKHGKRGYTRPTNYAGAKGVTIK